MLTEVTKVGVALEYIGSPIAIRTPHNPTAPSVSAHISLVEPPLGVVQVLTAWLGQTVELDTTVKVGIEFKDVEISLHQAGEGESEKGDQMHDC